ncbi:orotidine-5'-phosphate decarboxylase [Sugiyamaella lignohabitans]|uniref:Orotidine 5'-phosphate decarboxylase n=1 Tax=Sugiyamaella lignohabitans TaxID=796027 RepID=A0A167C0B0_9ASCO|nr:orotidine-5'-phosphate decarboxylase [Sugiyamaella lignohabitans]ANB11055.1 orotidine-5'-phosphate decarboxylase [Sugiyamaella lignohabitans]
MSNTTLSYEARAAKHPSAVASKLLKLMAEKKTNLCASLDVRTTKEFLDLLEKVGPYIAVVKSHIDIIDDFTYEGTIVPLLALAKKHNFLIFEDRKFADIGSTVKAQYSGGVYKIAKWSDITNAHSVPGAGIVNGLEEAAKETTSEERGLLMLAELSTKGSLATGEYTAKTVEIARQNSQFVFGFIAQSRMPEQGDEDWLILTPGVGLDDKGDGLGQQYRTVDQVVSTGTDVIIVGRGLFGKGRDPVAESKRYRDAGWAAYEKRLA